MYSKMTEETKAFVNLVKKSPVYVEYLNYKTLLEKQPEIKEAVDSFRRQSFEIQVGHNYGYFNAYENLVNLKQENDTLLGDPIVKAYLSAELKLSKMIASIFNIISEEIDFDVDFLG